MAVSGMQRIALALCIATGLFTAANEASAQATAVALTGTSYSRNFDGMATSASAAVPTGWGIFRSGSGALTPAFTSGSTGTVVGALAYSGSAAPTSGNAYLWVNGGAATGTDKSIGFLSTGSYPGAGGPQPTSRVLAGSTGMTKLGPGTLVLAGNNTISGTLAISIGTLEIAADSALGNAANDISLAGTLKITASMSLGSGRDVTGSGSFDIAPGTTLTTNGAFGMSAVTLSNGGTLDLQGSQSVAARQLPPFWREAR